jgi:hypothetical protein
MFHHWIMQLTTHLDNAVNSPIKGFVVGTTTFAVSLTSWIQLGTIVEITSWMQFTGAFLGIVGTGCGAFMGVVSVRSWFKGKKQAKVKAMRLKRRKEDDV